MQFYQECCDCVKLCGDILQCIKSEKNVDLLYVKASRIMLNAPPLKSFARSIAEVSNELALIRRYGTTKSLETLVNRLRTRAGNHIKLCKIQGETSKISS